MLSTYASYLVTDLDEEKKKEPLGELAKTIAKRKDDQKKEAELTEKEINKEFEEKKKEAAKTKSKDEQKQLHRTRNRAYKKTKNCKT